MHISEGVLSGPVLATGAAVAVAGVAVGLRKLDYERLPQVAVLSSAFFVASLIHVPLGPSSVHLVLNGLCGLILGWAVFPALAVALFLHALIFGFGGLTVLGVNTVTMALPAVVSFYALNRVVRSAGSRAAVFSAGFVAGAMAILLSCVVVGLSLLASGREFLGVFALIAAAHLPVMIIEGLVTGSVVIFLRAVKPELLEASNSDDGTT